MITSFNPQEHESRYIFVNTIFIVVIFDWRSFVGQYQLFFIDLLKVDHIFIQIDSLQIIPFLIFVIGILACWILYANADLTLAGKVEDVIVSFIEGEFTNFSFAGVYDELVLVLTVLSWFPSQTIDFMVTVQNFIFVGEHIWCLEQILLGLFTVDSVCSNRAVDLIMCQQWWA